MRIVLHRSTLERLLCFFLFAVILWKGGKALDATWMLAIIVSVITLADLIFVPKQEKISPPVVPWSLALLFLAWTILSFLHSTTKNVGLDEVIQTASLVLLFRFALTMPATRVHHFTSRLARVVSCAALLACGIGLTIYAFEPVSRFVGTFFDYRFSTDFWPNAWAEFLLFAWPLLLWSLFGPSPPTPLLKTGEGSTMLVRCDVQKCLVLGLVLGCLFLSYSRGALLMFAVQIVFLVMTWFMNFRHSIPLHRIVKNFLSVACVAMLFFVLSNQLRSQFHPVQSVLEKATFTASEGTSSVSERRQFWSQAITLAKQKPLFGFGPYSFRFLQPHLQQHVLATSDHPHNVFLKFAMERGVIAAVLFVLLVAYCLMSRLRQGYEGQEMQNDWILCTLMTVSIVGVLLHNLIDYNLQFLAIAAPFWLGLGLLAPRPTDGSSRGFSPEQFFSVLIALALLIVTVSEGRFLFLSSKARAAEVAGNFPEALRLYTKTDAALFPRDAWLSRARILIAGGTPEAAQDAIDTAMKLNAQDYRIWKLQGDLFIRQKDSAKALHAFGTAYLFGREDDLGITRVLVELLSRNRPALDARRHEFDLLIADFSIAIERNTHFIDLSTNVEELTKLCNLLAKVYPADAEAYRALSKRSEEHAQIERSRLKARKIL